MSLIDEVCADPILKDRVNKAPIAGKIKDAVDGEAVDTDDGPFSIQVSDVDIEIDDISPEEGSADGLEVTVVVKGTSTANGIYVDADNNEHAVNKKGTYEATVRVTLPPASIEMDPSDIAEEAEFGDEEISVKIGPADD